MDTFANPITWSTPEEAREEFERQVQSPLGITGEEFLRDLDASRSSDDPDDPDVLILAVLSDVVR
jgi:hypothetical protein